MKKQLLLYTLLVFGCSDTISTDGDPWSVAESEPIVEVPEPDPEPESDPEGEPIPPPDLEGADPVEDPPADPTESIAGTTWLQAFIGNCIDIEEWLVFNADSTFEYIVADRNACAEHHLDLGEGTWRSPAPHRLEFEWTSEDGMQRRDVTYAIVDQSLNTTAFLRNNNSFDRHDELEQAPGPYYRHELDIMVSFDEFPEPGADDCRMRVVIQATIDLGGDAAPHRATEEFDFDCETDQPEDPNRYVVYAEGHYDRGTDLWFELLRDRNIWERYIPSLADLVYRSFRPVLFLDTEQPYVAYTSIPDGWYQRSNETPPRTLEELEDRP